MKAARHERSKTKLPIGMIRVLKDRVRIGLKTRDMRVFVRELNRQDLTPTELVNLIVQEWASHPSRSRSVLTIDPSANVLFKHESLRDYLKRVTLLCLATVQQTEGTVTASARRLGYERTAFHKLIERLSTEPVKAPRLSRTTQTHSRSTASGPKKRRRSKPKKRSKR